MKQLWFVFPLDLAADPNIPYFAVVPNGNEPNFAQPIPDARLRRARNILDEPEILPVGGYGFKILAKHREDMMKAFTSKDAAALYAKEQAEKNPKVAFGVYSCDHIYETTTPTIIEKKFNDAGELIVL